MQRGLRRREAQPVAELAVDETSFQRGHEYVTVASDRSRNVVLHVADDRRQRTLESYYESLPKEHLEAIEVVTMDMWAPYIAATEKAVPAPGAEGDAGKIAFDKFHVAGHLVASVGATRWTRSAARSIGSCRHAATSG